MGNGAHSFANGLTIRSNASLTGNGTISGTVAVQAGGLLSPGASVGKFVLNNSPVLQGNVLMEISKNGSSITNDQIQVNGLLAYGGTLTVSNLGPSALSLGDRFVLFPATSYAGSFASLVLPPLDPGLIWNNRLLVDGSIQVVASGPQFTSISLSGTNLLMSGTGGPTNGTYRVLTATNVTLPLSNWVVLLTNQFNGSGNFIFTNSISPAIPRRFYVLAVP